MKFRICIWEGGRGWNKTEFHLTRKRNPDFGVCVGGGGGGYGSYTLHGTETGEGQEWTQ